MNSNNSPIIGLLKSFRVMVQLILDEPVSHLISLAGNCLVQLC